MTTRVWLYCGAIISLTTTLLACSSVEAASRMETVTPNRDSSEQRGGAGSEVTIAEETAIRIAQNKPYPAYPQSALDTRLEGQVIAKIRTDTSGIVRHVEILEATNDAFKKSAQTALAEWRLKPIRAKSLDSPPSPISVTLAFYFKLKDGKGRVAAASELAAERK